MRREERPGKMVGRASRKVQVEISLKVRSTSVTVSGNRGVGSDGEEVAVEILLDFRMRRRREGRVVREAIELREVMWLSSRVRDVIVGFSAWGESVV